MSVSKAEKKQGFMEKARKFFRSSWNELKKVHWPNKSELITYTTVVITAVLIVAAMIWVVDSILSFVLELLI